VSNCRASAIMSTIASATFTLLPSRKPEASLTPASDGAELPSRSRNSPSPPRTSCASSGLTSRTRPMGVVWLGVSPLGTTDTVPSAPIDTRVSAGTVIVPESPATVSPPLVCSTPFWSVCRLPARV
jgi:hypothetical protein